MTAQSTGPILSAVFVDYDNIYLSLRRKNEEAARRFAKDAGLWLKEIASGSLITPTSGVAAPPRRRLVMNRCYGNPVPRRLQPDNSTDMSSFPFVRHHFLRAGFEIIDCPPLTAQLKNSSDIRMVMDVRDYLSHETYFDEFVILSGDADFTPLLHRLRAHARRTVVFANDRTAAPYTAISDGEVRESDLIAVLLEGRLGAGEAAPEQLAASGADSLRAQILGEVVRAVCEAPSPVPLEALAERAMRVLGHERTVGSHWAGAGGFRELLLSGLPPAVRLTDTPPYLAYETSRGAPVEAPARDAKPVRHGELRAKPSEPQRSADEEPQREAAPPFGAQFRQPQAAQRPQPPQSGAAAPAGHSRQLAPPPAPAQPQNQAQPKAQPQAQQQPQQQPQPRQTGYAQGADGGRQPAAEPYRPAQPPAAPPRSAETAGALQRSVARIHEACQAPPLSPNEYRALFEIMASEITQNHLLGSQTITNILARTQELGIGVTRDDARFVLDVVGEADPWFDQGASAGLFASRFRNFVVARCRGQGLQLSAEELDLIDAWFAGTSGSGRGAAAASGESQHAQQSYAQHAGEPQSRAEVDRAPWWSPSPQAAGSGPTGSSEPHDDDFGSDEEFPRIIRTRGRG